VSDRRREADATLARLGLDADALRTGRASTDALAAIMGGPDGEALAAALGELASPEVAATLVALEPHARERAARREIRRALYRLRQRGIATPERPSAAPGTQPAEAIAEGLVSHFDGRGDRLLWIVRPLPTGGVLLIAAQANEPEGLRDVRAVEVGRKQLRRTRQSLEAEADIRLVPADWRTLDGLLVEAHARAGAPDRARDYLRARPRLTSDTPIPAAEPTSTRVAPPGIEEAGALAAASAALVEEPELRTWLPEPEAAAPFVEEIAGVRESPLVLSGMQQQERLRDILRRAAARLYPPGVLARRLEGTAYVLAETGRPAPARLALAVASVLRQRPEAAAEVPFVAALVERGFGSLVAADTARREDDRKGALVVTPGELRDRSSSRRGRTRG